MSVTAQALSAQTLTETLGFLAVSAMEKALMIARMEKNESSFDVLVSVSGWEKKVIGP